MAIAFDATSTGYTGAGSSLTVSHVCTGTNRFLLVKAAQNSGSDTLTGVTYNGVSMTKLVTWNVSGAPDYIFYLFNPASGTHDIVASSSSGANSISLNAVSYTGCTQRVEVINGYTTNIFSSVTSISTSITTSVDNCWAILASSYLASGTGGVTAGANTTERSDYNYGWIGDSNGPVHPAGSITLNASGSSTTWAAAIIAIAPSIDYSETLLNGSFSFTGFSIAAAHLFHYIISLTTGYFTLDTTRRITVKIATLWRKLVVAATNWTKQRGE